MANLFQTGTLSIFISFSDPIVSQLKSFSNLKDGWDFGDGKPISDHVINRAIKVYNYLKNSFFGYECSPLPNGGIQLTFCLLDHFIDVFVNKASFKVVYEKGIGENFDTIYELENVSLEKIKIILENIRNKCFSLGQSISQGTVSGREGFRSASRTWVAASPSLHMIAQSKSIRQSVYI